MARIKSTPTSKQISIKTSVQIAKKVPKHLQPISAPKVLIARPVKLQMQKEIEVRQSAEKRTKEIRIDEERAVVDDDEIASKSVVPFRPISKLVRRITNELSRVDLRWTRYVIRVPSPCTLIFRSWN